MPALCALIAVPCPTAWCPARAARSGSPRRAPGPVRRRTRPGPSTTWRGRPDRAARPPPPRRQVRTTRRRAARRRSGRELHRAQARPIGSRLGAIPHRRSVGIGEHMSTERAAPHELRPHPHHRPARPRPADPRVRRRGRPTGGQRVRRTPGVSLARPRGGGAARFLQPAVLPRPDRRSRPGCRCRCSWRSSSGDAPASAWRS